MAIKAILLGVRGCWRALAGMGTLLGIVYLRKDITELPEAWPDAFKWLAYMSTESLLMGYAIIATAWIAWIDIRRLGVDWESIIPFAKHFNLSKSPLFIDFIDIKSKDANQGDNYRVVTLIPKQPRQNNNEFMIVRRVCFLVHNTSNKTIFDVNCVVRVIRFASMAERVGHSAMFKRKNRPPIVLFVGHMKLPINNEEEFVASIAPEASVSFILLDDMVESAVPEVGSFSPMDEREIAGFRNRFKHTFAIGGTLSRNDFLRNNDIEINVQISGRDVKPVLYKFYLNLQNRFDVRGRIARKI